MFPGWTIWNTLKNTARQMITFDSSLVFMKSGPDGPFSKFAFVAPHYSHSLQAQGFLNNAVLENMNIFHDIVIVGSLLLGAYFIAICLRAGEFRPTVLVAIVALGLLANAFATGALGGVFGRYEGRGIWLIPFCTLVAGLALAKTRKRALTPKARPAGTRS
jgi:hypothetical protein